MLPVNLQQRSETLQMQNQNLWRRCIYRDEYYVKLANNWNPDKFDPGQWLDVQNISGLCMPYIRTLTFG